MSLLPCTGWWGGGGGQHCRICSGVCGPVSYGHCVSHGQCVSHRDSVSRIECVCVCVCVCVT